MHECIASKGWIFMPQRQYLSRERLLGKRDCLLYLWKEFSSLYLLWRDLRIAHRYWGTGIVQNNTVWEILPVTGQWFPIFCWDFLLCPASMSTFLRDRDDAFSFFRSWSFRRAVRPLHSFASCSLYPCELSHPVVGKEKKYLFFSMYFKNKTTILKNISSLQVSELEHL